jgi:spermidine synthase
MELKWKLSTCTFAFLLAISLLQAEQTENKWYEETLYPEWQQRLRIDRQLNEESTALQDLMIFENDRFGRVLALDGIIQTTEADEFVYHEMMAHIPIIAHGNVEKVLVIGGGDGGMIREVSRHKNIQRIVMVEIDSSVVEFSKKHLPMLSQGAFNDPRVELVIADGAQFVKSTEERFDVVICDSPDPIGPAAVLFTQEFYGDCKNILTEGGIFVTQNGVPFMQPSELIDTFERRKPFFKDTGYYIAPVTTYVGGFMAFGWATDQVSYRDLSLEELERRAQQIEGELKYYNPEIHKASFALPNFVKRPLGL